MASKASSSAADLDVEQAVSRFEQAWQRGEKPVISNYWQARGTRSAALLQALVVVDLEYRLKSGQRRGAEDYLREFPLLQTFEQTILKLLRIEAQWPVGGTPALTHGDIVEPSGDSRAADSAGLSNVAAVETASGVDGSAVTATRSSPKNSVSERDFSGATVFTGGSRNSDARPTADTLGKFRIVDVVGQGGFGTVFRAIDTTLGRVVAVKVPKKDVLGSAKEQERFLREAQSAASMRHDHIVTVFEVGGTAERPFIVSAFVSGCTLSKALESRRFEPREAAAIVRVVANALEYAHERGVVHRDVKPSNIMLDDRGTTFLMDFGLARRDGEALITVDGTILGTPAYMSPEQAEGKKADARSDIYSLGVVLYQLLTGERPFQGTVQSVLHQVIHTEPQSPLEQNRAVPRDLDRICLKCMRKIPDDRYPSAAELEDDLSRFLEGLPVRARPISPMARIWRWAWRYPRMAILLAVAAALTLSLPVMWANFKTEITKAKQQLSAAIETALRSEDANRARLEKLFVSKGNALRESGDPMHALPWFAAALDRAPTPNQLDPVHRVRLITTVLEGARLARLWRVGPSINSVARCPARPLLAIGSTNGVAMVVDLTGVAGAPKVLPHTTVLWQCAFSPDGKRLATSCNDGTVRIWHTSSLSDDPKVLQLEARPAWMGFDPTSRLLAAATVDGAVRLWDVSTGKLLPPVLTHRGAVHQLAFNADGSLVATACSDGGLHLWSVDTRKEVTVLQHTGSVNCVAFTPGGGSILSAGDDGTIRGWDAKSRSPQYKFATGSPVLHLAISADGNLVAAGCGDGRVHVWDLKTERGLPGDFRHERSVSSLSFSKGGEALVTGSQDRTARIWDLRTGGPAGPPLACGQTVVWAELNDDQKHLMTAGFDGFLREWSLDTPLRAEFRCADSKAVESAQLSPNGRWLLLTGTGGPARLCDLNDPKLVFVPLADSADARHAEFAADDKRLVLARKRGDLDYWDVSRQPKRSTLQSRTGPLVGIGLSPDGQSLVTANIDGTAQVVSVPSGGTRLTLPHGAGLKRAFYSRDGLRIYTAGGYRGLCLWDSASGNLLSEFQRPREIEVDEIDDCRLTPDGRFLLAVRHSTGAIVCDAFTGAFVTKSILHPRNVAFSNDGARLAATTTGNGAGTWNVATGRPVAPLVSHRGKVTCCAIRGDGTLFATGSADTTARVWDAETGEPVSPPLKHTDSVIFVEFREAGNQLVTVSADAVIRLWTLDDGTPTDRLVHLARATSGQQIDANGTAVALQPEQIEAEWNAARGATAPN
jgi:WD40 repeat protein/serine/threonine protein kinase